MKKPFLIIITILLVTQAGLLSQEKTGVKVISQVADVWAEPDLESPVIMQLKAGQLLISTGKIGGWYEIQIKDPQGNIISAFILAADVEVVEQIQPLRKVRKSKSFNRFCLDLLFISNMKKVVEPVWGINVSEDIPAEKAVLLGGAGFSADLYLNDWLVISPAVHGIADLDFEGFSIAPALSLNIDMMGGKGFMLGVGITKWIELSEFNFRKTQKLPSDPTDPYDPYYDPIFDPNSPYYDPYAIENFEQELIPSIDWALLFNFHLGVVGGVKLIASLYIPLESDSDIWVRVGFGLKLF